MSLLKFLSITQVGRICLNWTLKLKIADARFTGIGFDGEVYRIIDWLPRLAPYDSGWQSNPITYQNDWYQNPADVEVEWEVDKDFKIASNLNSSGREIRTEDGRKRLLFKKAQTTNIQFYLSNKFENYKTTDSIELFTAYKDPYLPSILPSLDEKVNAFFKSRFGDGFSKKYQLVILKNKIGEFQSDGVLSIDYPHSTFNFASNLAHARAEQIFRYKMEPKWL